MRILAASLMLCACSASGQFTNIYTTNTVSPLKGAWSRMETNFAVAATMIAAKTDTASLTSATNTLNTTLRTALAQTNIYDGRSLTNMGTIGHPAANSSFVTNGALIWFVTNNTPIEALPNGSIASVTDGRFFVRTNNTWLRK